VEITQENTEDIQITILGTVAQEEGGGDIGVEENILHILNNSILGGERELKEGRGEIEDQGEIGEIEEIQDIINILIINLVTIQTMKRGNAIKRKDFRLLLNYQLVNSFILIFYISLDQVKETDSPYTFKIMDLKKRIPKESFKTFFDIKVEFIRY
jgi:hypothetical protein